jgi:hypothetical protein
MNGRRRNSDAERLEHVQTLELLGHLIIQLPAIPEVHKQFVVFSSYFDTEQPERETQPLELIMREPAVPRGEFELAI